MSGLRITGFNNSVSPYFRGNDKNKGTNIGQPLAGLISPQVPKQPKLPTGIPMPTQPIGGLIKPPTQNPNPLPTLFPPLAGLVSPNIPKIPKFPTIPAVTAGLVAAPPEKTNAEEEETKLQDEPKTVKEPEATEE